MRHRRAGWKLGRNTSHRRALLRNLVTSLMEHERITTTVTKAKAMRPWAEKMITLGKAETLHARRQAAAFLLSPASVKNVFDKLAPRFSSRNGGYLRITRLGARSGDGAEMAKVELIGSELKEKAPEAGKKKRGKAAADAGAAEGGEKK
jgi:large subunit ribosomal protein L17